MTKAPACMRCRGLARPVRRYLADCPGELIRWGNQRTTLRRPTTGPGHPLRFRLPGLSASLERTSRLSKVAPKVPLSPPAGPKLPPNHGAFQGSQNSLQAPRSFLQVSRSSLRVVPVFAGREVSTTHRPHCTSGFADYFQDSLAVHKMSTG